jgi:hypothetical protein
MWHRLAWLVTRQSVSDLGLYNIKNLTIVYTLGKTINDRAIAQDKIDRDI